MIHAFKKIHFSTFTIVFFNFKVDQHKLLQDFMTVYRSAKQGL